MENIIEIKNLKKSFKDVKAVDDITFSVKNGELFAFLGLNGAGKSTTINIICGILQADSGQVFIDGENIEKSFGYKSKIGIVPQVSVLDKSLSVFDNLESRASLYNIFDDELEKRLEKIDNLLEIKELYNKQFGKLSGGQKRRIDIARAILQQPKVLILDEPTTGLDPKSRAIVWRALDKMRAESGTTIFLTTHYMEEASNANNIVIIDSGKIVCQGSPLELKNKYSGDFIKLYNTSESEVKKLQLPYTTISDGFKIEVKNTSEATKLITQYPQVFKDYEVVKGNIDDVFLAVTGKNLSEEGKK